MNESLMRAEETAKKSRTELIVMLRDCGVTDEVFQKFGEVWTDISIESYLKGLHVVTEAIEAQAYQRGFRAGESAKS